MASADVLGVDDVLTILTDLYGLQGTKHKNEFRMLCPEHDDHKPSCDVNLETGYWNCYSCPARGDLVALGCVVLLEVPTTAKKKIRMRARAKVRRLLVPNEPDAITAAIQRRVRARRSAVQPVRRARQRDELRVPSLDAYEDGPTTYLRRRGFSRETIEKWNIKFANEVTLFKEDGDSFTLRNSVCIPILDEDSESVLAWCYRATDDSDHWFRKMRYIYTPGTVDVLSRNWFGMDQHGKVPEVTITEGALDAIWNDQWGFPALAILGSNVKQDVKIRKLTRYQSVNLMTDRDPSGVATAFHLGESLMALGVPCTVTRYASWMQAPTGKEAKDAQDLCGLDLELAHVRKVPFLAWKHQRKAS